MDYYIFNLEQEKQMRAVLGRCVHYASEGQAADPDWQMMEFARNLVGAAKEVQAIIDATMQPPEEGGERTEKQLADGLRNHINTAGPGMKVLETMRWVIGCAEELSPRLVDEIAAVAGADKRRMRDALKLAPYVRLVD